MSSALIIVDVQHDFLPGGALGVPDGDGVLQPIVALAADGGFDLIVATRDWHPPDHSSFVEQGGPWPVHCVAGSPGAQLDDRLPRVDAVIDKGVAHEGPGYSGFEGEALRSLLTERGIDAVTIVGLAADYCVAATARDAVDAGLSVTIDRSAIRGIDDAESERALDELTAAGARIESPPGSAA